MSYMHIQNLYQQQDILFYKECYALEKIHGTSAHIKYKHPDITFSAGGSKHESFVSLFDQEALKLAFEALGHPEVTIYGEAYGGKMQGMKETYGDHLKFVAFEVLIGDSWLAVPQAEEVVLKLGLEFVYYKKIPAILEAIDAERDADSIQAVRNGMGPGKIREGIVLRPLIEVTKNNDCRIICKHKRDEFAERKHVPVDPSKIEKIKDAQRVADEFVVPMRLEHVLQKLPHATGMEHTKDVIKAMMEDVYREGADEVEETQANSAAIGRATAKLWKAHVSKLNLQGE